VTKNGFQPVYRLLGQIEVDDRRSVKIRNGEHIPLPDPYKMTDSAFPNPFPGLLNPPRMYVEAHGRGSKHFRCSNHDSAVPTTQVEQNIVRSHLCQAKRFDYDTVRRWSPS
jgi:hypothetical protein